MASGTPRGTLWELDHHTKAKHDILRQYLAGWFPVLSSYQGRVVFLDGFAGPGRYKNGEPGSPLIALSTLLDHSYFPRMTKCEFLFIFCEQGRTRADNLKEEIQKFADERGTWPENVKVSIKNSEFERTAQDILETLKAQKAQLAPTFAFVDPFGISGLPMDLLADLLSFNRCELFVNYIVNTAVRFANSGMIDERLRELYGTDDFLKAEGLQGQARLQFLHDLYERQLKARCGFDYVQSFGMLNKTGNVIYYLFYGTRNPKGLQLMKDAMWKVDAGGGYKFSDRLAGQDILFSEEDLVPEPLRSALLTHFAGRTVLVDELETFVLVHTPYRPAHLRKYALSPLEKDGKISVDRPGRSGFPAGRTRITFRRA
ncbi:three-Cys-motif partner protein TcmP [Micromonospora sp. NPDC001898]|uniref:three-Cys-motif partner protein TcmP n=1 Tax=Micromonospora sp. NPDC001898 TaxID=3364221 RepID=UPI00367486B7